VCGDETRKCHCASQNRIQKAREGAGSRMIHESEDLPKFGNVLGEKANPQADRNRLGDFFIFEDTKDLFVRKENDYDPLH
jgi:hypothetical protein